MPVPVYEERRLQLRADPAALFRYLDDPRHLGEHMQRRRGALAGGSLRLQTDARRGLGSGWRLDGQVLGLRLQAELRVTGYQPPWRKSWQTQGRPRLLVIGAYRMGFELCEQAGSQLALRLWLEGEPTGWGRWLARVYARWCLREMAAAARRAAARAP